MRLRTASSTAMMPKARMLSGRSLSPTQVMRLSKATLLWWLKMERAPETYRSNRSATISASGSGCCLRMS